MTQEVFFSQKPIEQLLQLSPIELHLVLDKVIFTIAAKSEYHYILKGLKTSIEQKEPKIVLKTTKQHFVLHTKDIIHLVADGAYTNFYTTTKKIMVSKNIKYYQRILDNTFIRCHQSHLVNSKHVLGIDKKGLVRLTNNERVPISMRNRAKVIKQIDTFQTLRNVS